MRVAAILGLGCSSKQLKPFQSDSSVEWRVGMPASPSEADAVLLFGGDGTIHRHLSQLVKIGLPVLVVPAGSGNDFARALGIRSVKDALAAWKKFCSDAGNVSTIDLGVITPLDVGEKPEPTRDSPPDARYFCCIASVGLDAEVQRRANQLPRWLRGHGGYVLSFAPTPFTFAPLPMKISIPTNEGTHWTIRSDQPTILAAFANTPVYGGGMRIAPQAKMDDGLLDICVIGSIDSFKLFCMFPTVYSGRHLKIKEVSYFTAPRVRVETERPLDVYADGEYVCRTPIEVSVQPKALRAITL